MDQMDWNCLHLKSNGGDTHAVVILFLIEKGSMIGSNKY